MRNVHSKSAATAVTAPQLRRAFVILDSLGSIVVSEGGRGERGEERREEGGKEEEEEGEEGGEESNFLIILFFHREARTR